MTQSGTVNNNWPMAIEEPDNLDYWLSNRPTESYVFVGNYYFPLSVKNEKEKNWLGRSKIILSDRKSTFPELVPNEEDANYESGSSRRNINRFLYEAKAAPLDNRIPVLTYGSNTHPQQLDQKFNEPGINEVIPLVKCRALNLEVVFSAHRTKYGFMAPTLFELTGAKAEVFVAFHSREQLEHISKELANDGYDFYHFRGENFRLEFDKYDLYLDEYYAFLPKSGALLLPTFRKRVAHIKHSGNNSQLDTVITHKALLDLMAKGELPEAFSSMSVDLIDIKEADIYSDIKLRNVSEKPNQPNQPQSSAKKIKANRNTSNRSKGDYNIYLPPSTGIKSSQVILTTIREGTPQHLLVKTTKEPSKKQIEHKPVDETPIADVDLTIRNALGIEVGETLEIEPFKSVWKDSISKYIVIVLDILGAALIVALYIIKSPEFDSRRWGVAAVYWLILVGVSLFLPNIPAIWGRWILRPIIPDNYLIMRMTPAAKLFEREACAMPEIAFDLLGIETGDKVVLEAVTKDEHNIRIEHCVVRAYKRDEIALNTALNLSTDDPDSVFADCSEILDVFPDIEPIIVNYDLRKQLGLENQKCAPIRVRISKQYRVAKEFRNGVIAILLVLIGTLSLFENQQLLTRSISSVIFVISLIVIAIMSFWALRERLSP